MTTSTFLGTVIGVFLFATPTFAQFKDVSSGRSDATAIKYVYQQGIVKGYADGTFKPDARINRAEFAKIAVLLYWDGDQRRVDACNSTYFTDVPKGPWYFSYICGAKDQGIVEGYATGVFRPGNTITVAEAVKMMSKAFKLETAPEDVWYKPYVRALANRAALPRSITSLEAYITRGQLAEIAYRLHANVTNEPSLTYGELTGENFFGENPCTDDPMETEIGSIVNPIDPKYTRLPQLGQLFTAVDCGSKRLAELYGDLSGKVMDLHLELRGDPSSQLYNELYTMGFSSMDGVNSSRSRVWELRAPTTYKSLLKLRPFVEEFKSDDCISCG